MDTLTKCLQTLQVSSSDNERLAAMMIISKLFDKIHIEDSVTVDLFQAISPAFLVRLLKPNPSAPSKNSFRMLAVSILCYFGKTNPALLVQDTNEHRALIEQMLDLFNKSDLMESISLFQDVLDIFVAIADVDNGSRCLMQNKVFTKLEEVLMVDGVTDKVLSLYGILLQQHHCHQQPLSQQSQQQKQDSLDDDFIKLMTTLCRSFRINQELEKFKYIHIVSRLLQILLDCKIYLDYHNTGLKRALKSCVTASKDMLQSHLKAEVKRSVLCLLCTIVRLCGVEWMFDYNFVEAADSFVILVLVNITIETAFLLQLNPMESEEESQAVQSGLFITEQILQFICSSIFEKSSLAADGEFVYKVFSSFKNVMRSVYVFFTAFDTDNDQQLSCKHPVVVSAVSMLSVWATEETENLRSELGKSLPILRKLADEDLENVVQNGKDAIVLDTMASFIAQTLPDKEMRKTLVFCQYHVVYIRYLSHLIMKTETTEGEGDHRTFEQLIHILHQFIILEPKLCNEDSNFQDVCTKLLHFVPEIPSKFQVSDYTWLEVIIVTLRLLTIYRTEYGSMVEELMKFSIRFVQKLYAGALDEECLEVWFVAMQSIIGCCEMYKEHVPQLVRDLDRWSTKGKLTKDMKEMVDQLARIWQ